MAARKSAAGLSRETLVHLQAFQETRADILLVPEASEASSSASSSVRSLAESLPQVWQDLFQATAAAQSNEYLDRFACQPPLAPPHPAAESSTSSSGSDDPTLGINRDTVFSHFLSPEMLVQRHRLGKPQVRRLYQALQVYSLGFHQTCVELTAHATQRSLLLLSIWRGFAMLWDGALQVVYPSETVQTSRERQAALMMSEQLEAALRQEQEQTAALEQENAALRQQLEGMAVQVLSAQADLAVARQGAAALDQQLKDARKEAATAVQQADRQRLEVLALQDKIAVLGGPQEELFQRVQQLERLLKEKQTQLSAAAKQAAEALDGKEAAKQATRAERLAREAAERRVEQLQADVELVTKQLQEAAAAASVTAEKTAAEVAALKGKVAADAAAREDDTARQATERASWQRAAREAEATLAGLRQQLAAAQAAVEEEKARNEQLVASLWPLAAKVKALEAAAAGAPVAAAAAVPLTAAAAAAVAQGSCPTG